MLAITEKLLIDKGLDWAFCDTDSMAIAKPLEMDNSEFFEKAKAVCNWFEPLNPYAAKGPLLKIENANYEIQKQTKSDEFEPLYCFAISAKRYALFNLDKAGNPEIRKASAHGLGHLLSPYSNANAPKGIQKPKVDLQEIGVERWQHDYWYCLLEAALAGNPERPDLSRLPGFDKPAVSRYAATTPELLRWFKHYNARKPYPEQVKPFNFLLAAQAKKTSQSVKDELRPIAPYSSSLDEAEQSFFDRSTGEPINPTDLRTYREVLAQYHLHPETKFLNADYLDCGQTLRRHVEATIVQHIGKEANRWEEQYHLGTNTEAQMEYGLDDQAQVDALEEIKRVASEIGVSELARRAGYSRQYLSRILNGNAKPSSEVIEILSSVIGEI